jgi:23S rRNA (adenine2503-C2)-methyltransferase
MQKTPLIGISPEALAEEFKQLGQPVYRAAQVIDWIYAKGIFDFASMSNLPAALRTVLDERFDIGLPEVVRVQGATDTTRKLLLKLADGRFVECVLIPANPALYGRKSDRLTLCVSSQVGCAFDCKFCASGLAGFERNLGVHEIVGQVLAARAVAGQRIDNLVFMGMGEPLANLGNLTRSLEMLNAPWGLGIGARHMTVSTSGLAPMIRKLAQLPLQIRLAVSLHGATDDVRSRIMPVNDRYPLDELFAALEEWRAVRKQRITFEFILIEGVNDSPQQAAALAERASALGAKVNCIPYNTVEGLDWQRPDEQAQDAFMQVLEDAGITATIRREKGHDIDAACGQLRLREAGELPMGKKIS